MSYPTGSSSDGPDRDLSSRHRALGEGVRARREALGLRQSELADLAGCSVRFVHTLEVGKDTVRLDKVLDVLEVLGLSLELTSGTGRIRAPNESGEAGSGGR
jgi:y4mF family transcriptional regulator